MQFGYVHEFVPGQAAGGPTLLLLHGTGGDEHDLLPLGAFLAPGAALLSPRGNVAENGMPRFFRRLTEGVFDLDDLVRRSRELAAFVTAAAGSYGFDPAGVVAVGFSNGANIASATLLLHPGAFRAAVLLAGMVPLEPPDGVDLSGAAAFLGAGRADPIAPPEQTERLARLLSDRGAAVELAWHPGGHSLDPAVLRRARDWLTHLHAATAAEPGALP